MIKPKLLACTLILLTSCTSNVPLTAKDALSDITITTDKFDASTTIETPLYLSRKGFTDTFPVSLKFKAYYKGTDRQFVQMYVSMLRTEWGFYERAVGEDGVDIELVKIAREVDYKSSIKTVTVEEGVGLMLSNEELQKIGSKDFSIKLYGKRDSGDFVVPSSLTQAFIHKLDCYEAKSCK